MDFGVGFETCLSTARAVLFGLTFVGLFVPLPDGPPLYGVT